MRHASNAILYILCELRDKGFGMTFIDRIMTQMIIGIRA